MVGGYKASALSSVEIYDPISGKWKDTAHLNIPRYRHSTTLLPSGQVLVVGGYNGSPLSSAELYDPITETWKSVEDLTEARYSHSSTLLPSGKVLVAGGGNGSSFADTVLYGPSTGKWQSYGDLATNRFLHTSTLLPSGRVLVAGGSNGSSLVSAEIFNLSSLPNPRYPIILSSPQSIQHGHQLQITGSQFYRNAGSSSNTQDSAASSPLVHLRTLDGTQHYWLTAGPQGNFWDDPTTLTIGELPSTLNPGLHFLTVIAAGLRSEPVVVDVECSLVITRSPTDQLAYPGESVMFNVTTLGGRHFQWQRNGLDIPGATGSSYTTPQLTVADPNAATYRVFVGSGCTSEYSETATLTLADDIPPTVQVTSPVGGERWSLSSPIETHTELLTWITTDNIRICHIDVDLLHSDDAGQTWQETPPATGGLSESFSAPAPCLHPGQQTTSLEYTLPGDFPSGSAGSLYKLRVRATDQAGHLTEAVSENPFTSSNPPPTSRRSSSPTERVCKRIWA